MKFSVDYSQDNIALEDLVGFDLCVLASSDHTIFDYGSFGMWGALFAGGDVIVSKGTSEEGETTQEDDIYLRANMTDWTFIDTRGVNASVLKINPIYKNFYIL